MTPEAQFKEFITTFATTARDRSGQLSESYYAFAGQQVKICCVGSELARHLDRAFFHLKHNTHSMLKPQLTIELWDAEITEAAKSTHSTDARGDWFFDYEEGVFTGSADGRFMGYLRQESAVWLDRFQQRIVGWQASGQYMPIHVRSKPLSLLLSIWYNDLDIQIIHAGLVARHGKGVLIAGPSGAGKTTTTLTCVEAGFSYLGDDFVGVQQLDDATFLGYSLYHSARLEPAHLRRFSRLVPYALQGQPHLEEKALVFVTEVLPDQTEPVIPIKAMIFPQVNGSAHTNLRPISKGQALLRCAYSSLRIPARGQAHGLDKLGNLVGQVPTYWLELGSNLEEIPLRIIEVLEAGDL